MASNETPTAKLQSVLVGQFLTARNHELKAFVAFQEKVKRLKSVQMVAENALALKRPDMIIGQAINAGLELEEAARAYSVAGDALASARFALDCAMATDEAFAARVRTVVGD